MNLEPIILTAVITTAIGCAGGFLLNKTLAKLSKRDCSDCAPMVAVKKAIVLLVQHSKDIPPADKSEALQELL